MKTFIDERQINNLIKKAEKPPRQAAERIIVKALQLKGLTPAEAAVLLAAKDKKVLTQLFRAARTVKEAIYGKRLVLFAPLYTTNFCVNDCLYCGFRSGNTLLTRRRLTIPEIKAEVRLLEKEGHKRILLVAGEDPKTANVTFLLKAIKEIYATRAGKGEIRRLNVNIAPLSVADFRRLKKSKIGTFQLFQETYHQPTYKTMHIRGPKADYRYRLYGMHRAMEAGIDDVGIGVLFGLYDFKFEALALLYHALELEKEFGAGPHTISVPRIEPAVGAPLSLNPPFQVTDEDFKKVVAVLRLAVPYTGIILSTRESAKMRNELFALGISQISAGSRTNPGGYSAGKHNAEQFSLHDSRSLLQVIKDISQLGYSPSFCTACYRLGRVGHDFMDLAKPGLIKQYCLPNSLLTFQEYLLDYGDKEAKKLGKKVIAKHLAGVKNKKLLLSKLKNLEAGKRDLYY
ncbi:MAG: [FeFe] hydrogenase H-cluster radical SAM maturase HydG [Candidatus Margulisbacteria bacterium]|jgi:2-iminoacetate synthase|nr:[FeFe] hydrogenase H-cluster radical SAM maturase HydG [Candidatus Margulisiibacteriota bacterium]